MIVLLILTNIATAVWAVIYALQFYWQKTVLDAALRSLDFAIQVLKQQQAEEES